MAKRHDFTVGDWTTIATRMDEIISAHTGEDPFEESWKLLVAVLMSERVDSSSLAAPCDDPVSAVNSLLMRAQGEIPGLLPPGTITHLTEPELRRCLTLLHGVRLTDHQAEGLDAIFEFIINRASKGQKGQFFTPRYVVQPIVEMLGIQAGELVVDPACGSGAFLAHAMTTAPGCSVWGFDQDHRAVRVARTLMVAHRKEAWRIGRTDSLRRPNTTLFGADDPVIEDIVRTKEGRFNGFDVVATNPPFAGDVGATYSETYTLAATQRVERDVLFIERCVELLRPGGRFAIVLPHNKLGGKKWARVRRWLLHQTRVVGVVGLGRNTFMPHTSQKADVVVGFKRKQPLEQLQPDESVVFFISERDGKDSKGRLRIVDSRIDHDLSEAVEAIRPVVRSLHAEGR